jgi:hypothetical protein
VNTEEYDSNIRHEDGSGGEKNVQANETPDESVSLSLPNSEIFYKDRYNWFTEYPIKPREQSTSINSISRRGLTQMPFCDIGLHK